MSFSFLEIEVKTSLASERAGGIACQARLAGFFHTFMYLENLLKIEFQRLPVYLLPLKKLSSGGASLVDLRLTMSC